MIKNIMSKIHEELLLHTIFRYNDITEQRQDISSPDEFLQISTFSLEYGKTFRPHIHIPCEKLVTMTCECWVLTQGKVLAKYYDIDGTFIESVVLGAGDLTVTYRGGHTYESLNDETRIYEIKNGPYFGQEKDKKFID